MASKSFSFTVDLPAPVSTALLRDLLARICAAASCRPDSAAELTPEIEAAIARATVRGGCELRFEAHDRTLDVTVQAGPTAIWQTSRPTD